LAEGAKAKGTKRKGLRGVIKTPRKDPTLDEQGVDKNLADAAHRARQKCDTHSGLQRFLRGIAYPALTGDILTGNIGPAKSKISRDISTW
jgi:hypothetical protein